MAISHDDLEGRVVSPLRDYDAGTTGPVRAVEIRRDGVIDGALFLGTGAESGHAGSLVRMGSATFADEGLPYWDGELRRMWEAGVPAEEAVVGLLGSVGPGRAGTVGAELLEFPSKKALRDVLDPPGAAEREEPRAEASRPSRDEIDAVLRGSARSTPAIDAAITTLDGVLAIRPTPEPIVLTQIRSRASLPEELVAGTVVEEPTYLQTLLAGADALLPEGEVEVKLRVPAGVPAMFQPAELPAHPGTLLLGRGLRWRVLRVVPLGERTLVTGEIVAPLGA